MSCLDCIFCGGRRLLDVQLLVPVCDACEPAFDALDDIVAANPKKVEQAKTRPTLAGWFVGQVMKAIGGTAARQAVTNIVNYRLAALHRFPEQT
jgi:hypothetical protein